MPRLTGIYSGASTSDELSSNAYISVVSSGLSSGTIIMYVADILPAGWLLCDGSAVSRTTYSALFSAIGTTYGTGNGSTTFNLPNMTGKMPIGVKSGGNVGSLGATGGSFNHVHQMGAHTHAQSHTHTIAHTHTISHSHTIDHYHAVGTHQHPCDHTHSIPAHYHNVSGSAAFGNHTHTTAISSGSSGSGRVRTNATPTSGSAGTTAATGWSYSTSIAVGPNSLGDSAMNSSAMINQEAGTTSGSSGSAIGNTSTYSGSTDSVSANTGSSSVASSSAYASNTGGMTTTENVLAANPPFLTVNFIIKT